MRASVVRQVECEERKLSGRLKMARSQHSIKTHTLRPSNSSSSSSNSLPATDKQPASKRSRHESSSTRNFSAVGRREMQQQQHHQDTATGEPGEQQVFTSRVVELGGEPASRTSSGSSSGYNGRAHFYRPHHHQFAEQLSRPVPPPPLGLLAAGAHYDNNQLDDDVELNLDVGHHFDASASLLIDDDDDGTFEQHPEPSFKHSSHQRPQYSSLPQCADSGLHHSSLALHQYQHQPLAATPMRHHHSAHHRDEQLVHGLPGSRYSLAGQSMRERLANELIDTSEPQPQPHRLGASNHSIKTKKKQVGSSGKTRHRPRDTNRELLLRGDNRQQQLFYQHQYLHQPPQADLTSLGYHHLFQHPVEQATNHRHFRYLEEPSYLYPGELGGVAPLVHTRQPAHHYQQAATTTNKNMHPPSSREANPAAAAAASQHQTPSAGQHHQRNHHRNHHSSSRKQPARPSSRSSTSSTPKTPMSCCGQLTKLLLFVANLLFWTTGIALGSWGILNLVDDHKYNLSQLLVFEAGGRMSLFQLLSWSFITLGCATVLVGFCGCSAILKNNRWILGLYIFLILAIFALDLATGLLAIIFQERLVASVRVKLANKLRSDYGVHASFTAALDYIQTRYECCGSEGHLDYEQSLWRLQRLGGFEATVARTCCHLRNTYDDQAHVNPRPVNESMCQSTDVRFHQSYRYRKGCIDDLERLIRQKIWNFIMGCGAAGAVILISLMFATCFCRLIPKSKSRKSSVEHNTTGSNRNHTTTK